MWTAHLTSSPEDLQQAAKILKDGGLVAFPTETVYGLGANALDAAAVKNIFSAKGRPADNPLIVHLSCWEEVYTICEKIPPIAKTLADRFWPGPLTMLLPRRSNLPDVVTAGLSTVGVRCPNHPLALKLIRAAGVPIAAPSANRSGKPSPTEFSHLIKDLDGRVDALLDGGPCQIGVESTVLDVTSTPPRLLRPGGVTLPMLQEVLGEIQIDDAVMAEISPGAVVRSPGMKYRHYAPAAPVTILQGSPEDVRRYLLRKKEKGVRFAILCYDEESAGYPDVPFLCYGSREDPLSLSHHLFSALRQLDQWKLDHIYARCPEGDLNFLAVENRLKKAAGFHIISLSNPCIAGLTGGSGAGKTQVLSLLQSRGAFCLDADRLYHELLHRDPVLQRELGARFPSCVSGSTVDRPALSKLVFSDAQALKDLNTITHRHILAAVRREFSRAGQNGAALAVLDAPTLFESGFDRECAYTISVTAPEELRLKRILARDAISPDQAKARLRHQHDSSYFETHCDFIIHNDGSLASLERQVGALWQDLQPIGKTGGNIS